MMKDDEDEDGATRQEVKGEIHAVGERGEDGENRKRWRRMSHQAWIEERGRSLTSHTRTLLK